MLPQRELSGFGSGMSPNSVVNERVLYMRKSTIYLIGILLNGLLLVLLLLIHPFSSFQEFQATLMESKRLARELHLTDICLFTEARYTRHPTQADLHSAFQDHPVAMEHFPSGSFLLPPEYFRRSNNEVD